MGDGKIIDRIFADALSQMEPGGAAPQASAGGPGEEKEQTMENDTGATAEDLPPAGGEEEEEDLDALLENLTQNAEEPPAADGDRDLDEVLDEMFPDGPAAEGAGAPAPGPAGASPLDDLMASAMDIEDMPALDEAPEDGPEAIAGAAPEDPALGLGEGLGADDGESPAPASDDADLAAMAADLEASGALPDAGDGLPSDAAGDDLSAQAAGADDALAGLTAGDELEAAAPKKKARPRKKTQARAAEEGDAEEGRPAAGPLPDDLADLAAAAEAAEKEEGALGAGAAPAGAEDEALAAMAAMAGGEGALGAPAPAADDAETGADDDAALRSMGLDGPAAASAEPAAPENPIFVSGDAPALEDADKERLLAHLAARFDVLARRKLHSLPASQVRLIRSVNLRVDIELKFGEFSASGDDDSLFRLDE